MSHTFRFVLRFERYVDVDAESFDEAVEQLQGSDPWDALDLPDWVDDELIAVDGEMDKAKWGVDAV